MHKNLNTNPGRAKVKLPLNICYIHPTGSKVVPSMSLSCKVHKINDGSGIKIKHKMYNLKAQIHLKT